jgi:hypothetical protein
VPELTRVLRPEDFDFNENASAAVLSDSPRFVIPAPDFADGGEPLARPDGKPLVDRQGRTIEGRGIAFIDPDDRAWEVAHGDGTAAILISPMNEPVAAAIAAEIARLVPSADALTVEQVRELLAFARRQPGVRATYATTRAYVAEAMVPGPEAAAAGYGLYHRRSDQICRAVFVPGRGEFLGPAASPQLFDDGAVVLKHGDSVRLIQSASFELGYRFLDGRMAHAVELPVQDPPGR